MHPRWLFFVLTLFLYHFKRRLRNPHLSLSTSNIRHSRTGCLGRTVSQGLEDGGWRLPTFLPTSILTILVLCKVYMACFRVCQWNGGSGLTSQWMFMARRQFFISALELLLTAIVSPGSFVKTHVVYPPRTRGRTFPLASGWGLDFRLGRHISPQNSRFLSIIEEEASFRAILT